MKKLSFLILLFIATIGDAFGGAILPPTFPASSSIAISPYAWNLYGDSLTVGGQDGLKGSITVGIQSILGTAFPINSYGIGGQGSTQIAIRMGAVALPITLTGNSVTTSQGQGAATTITALNGSAIQGTNTTNNPDYRALATAADNTTRYAYGTVCGVHGWLKRTSSGGPPSTTENAFFIGTSQPYSTATACSALSTFVFDSSKFAPQPFIFEGGRNNYTNTATVQSDWDSVAALAVALKNNNFLFLTILNGDYPTEISGQTNYNTIIAENSYLTSTYANNSWDWRPWLIAQYSVGNVVDVLNHTNDVIPYTLRAVVGTGTLNGSITSSGCPTLTQSTGTLSANQTLKVDSEYIYVLTVSTNVVSTCTRGYGAGGVAASHNSGAAYTLVDPLHLSSAAYNSAGAYIANNYKNLLTPTGTNSVYASPANLSSLWMNNPAPLGSNLTPTSVSGDLNVNGAVIIPYQQYVLGIDANGNYDSMMRISSTAQLYLGGSNVTQVNLGTGGAGGLLAQQSKTNGDFANTFSYLDQSFSYNQPTTGTTVVMADTSDAAIDDPAGTLTALTQQLPTCSSTYNGKTARFMSTQIITTLTITATGGSIVGAPANPFAANTFAGFLCRGTNSTWYRIQ